jgi:hypothetical protein
MEEAAHGKVPSSLRGAGPDVLPGGVSSATCSRVPEARDAYGGASPTVGVKLKNGRGTTPLKNFEAA